MSKIVKLRGSAPRRMAPHALGEIGDGTIDAFGKQLIHRIAIGQKDLSGDDVGAIFAHAICGEHLSSPLGITDVVHDRCAWSSKTVKSTHPFQQERVRIISGRNSVAYSKGIDNPQENVEVTGAGVLSIWNARVDEALAQYNDLRIVVLLRNMQRLEFLLFEKEAHRYVASEYKWIVNDSNNLEGFDRENKHVFTWQPHGAQFTVIHDVPASGRSFKLNTRPKVITVDDILNIVNFSTSWVQKVQK